MDQLTVTSPVADFVTDVFGRYRIFQRLRIDFCCRGRRSLVEACHAVGADPNTVYAELMAYQVQSRVGQRNWLDASLTELCNHIQSTHHGYLKREIPRLRAIIAKVAEVHGQRHPELQEVADTFAAMAGELESHMRCEETSLFPAIRRTEAGTALDEGARSPVQTILDLEDEHVRAGDAMEHLRKLTNNYTPPADACNTYRAMLMGLEDFETDLHEHVHKENNILHPKVRGWLTS